MGLGGKLGHEKTNGLGWNDRFVSLPSVVLILWHYCMADTLERGRTI